MADESDGSIIPIEAFFGEDGITLNASCDPRPALERAEIIIGVDVMSRHEFLVFGREMMERVAGTAQPESVPVMRIGLDQDTDELEKLLALVEVVKGRHEYQSR